MSHYRRAPRPVSLALDRLDRELAPLTLLAEVQAHWSEAVGAAIAAHATPTAERAGVLTVSCSASVWAHELDLMAPVVLERLAGRVTRGRVTRLRCVALPPRRDDRTAL